MRPAVSQTSKVLPAPTRRGLSRGEAAEYVGVGTSKFDEMISDGRMPHPKRIDGRKVWDVRALDSAFDRLPSDNREDHNPWDD
ncbi:excisionase family DNA-binding protein [Corticibacterium sp. UT-5YL-CI-8]|nr:excisionase family DNA-binding protein [Tianweitania sp. UT-5YL-CI-8]